MAHARKNTRCKGPARRAQRAPKIALIQPIEVPRETNFIWIFTSHRTQNGPCQKKYPLQKARQKGTKCGPKSHNLQYRPTIMSKLPSQTIPTLYMQKATTRSIQWPQAEQILLLWAHKKTKMGPGPKLNLVTRWRDDVNLSMPRMANSRKKHLLQRAPQKGTKCGPKAHNA